MLSTPTTVWFGFTGRSRVMYLTLLDQSSGNAIMSPLAITGVAIIQTASVPAGSEAITVLRDMAFLLRNERAWVSLAQSGVRAVAPHGPFVLHCLGLATASAPRNWVATVKSAILRPISWATLVEKR